MFIQQVFCAIISLILLLCSCSSEKTDSETTHLGGCILISEQKVPSDLYQESVIIPTNEYKPFTKKLSAYGITLIGRDDISDDFMRKVAKTIKEMFPQDGAIDVALQKEVLRNLYRHRAVIPFFKSEDHEFASSEEADWDLTCSQNSICDCIYEAPGPGQVNEVVEHILHFVTDVGLHYTFPDEWGISEKSKVYACMQEAIDKGYYNVPQYHEDEEEEEEKLRILIQEFAYWVIFTAWDLFEPYGPKGAEWTMVNNASDLQAKLPQSYQLIEQTIPKVMNAPSLLTLDEFAKTAVRAETPAPKPASTYSKPTFEPMSFERYKAAYPNLSGLSYGISKFFDTYINVYGVTIAAMPNTPIPEIIHSGKVYAQLVDSDEDFIPDDKRIYDYHQNGPEGKRVIIILVDSKADDNAWCAYEPGNRYWMNQALRPGKAGVGHSRDGEFDVAVEELFHRFGKAWQSVYPDDFGLPDAEAGDTWSSTISSAMDRARGIDRRAKPVHGKWVYPEGAWYTYDATSCGWGCMLDEYFWHIWATNIGYQANLTRGPGVPKEEAKPEGWCDNLYSEWKPCSKEDLRRIDKAAYALLNNRGYELPNTIPYGEYGGNDVEYHGHEIEVRRTDSGDRFFINRNQHPDFTFRRSNTYYFDQSLESNSGYVFRFSTTKDGTHDGGLEYTDGVTTKGSPGVRGSYTRITVPSDAPDTLYYYCTSHSGMAGEAVITIVSSSKNISSTGDKSAFTKRVDVFGLHIYATNTTGDDKLLHAANILAEYIDNDEDGIPDNPKIMAALLKRNGSIAMKKTGRERITGPRPRGQGLWDEETIPNGRAQGRFDASLEEILHMVTDNGWEGAYPEVFGRWPGTEIAEAMDLARGGQFQGVPDEYPEGAWYSYDDETCDYNCQVAEYIYWTLTSILGAQDYPGRLEQIDNEWRLNTREKVKERDPAVYAILTNPEYKLPTLLPDGKYKAKTFTIQKYP